MMFGIPDREILSTGDDVTFSETADAVSLSSLQPIPRMLDEGVDSITVSKTSANRYRIEYFGFLSGHLRTTEDGMKAFGKTILADESPIPAWVLDSATAEVPWWAPDDYEPPAPIECGQCREETPVRSILTPLESADLPYVCRDCWDANNRN
ncbi:hypothetical protein NDI56_16850 [Haloarcula sp. S1CR25-12]|uniref:Small CPxCG-related zinc finger protein n=1 Tax=Haloarcula saliterrae TaxID=2950534 RepID=A0ABU2FFP8_9EURY|nr:hypothetical protein [Haloarcula sp. S1CR25-12]MDS0261069.1 hypothetical protein [Haloarcula sp. S1CR25-12]